MVKRRISILIIGLVVIASGFYVWNLRAGENEAIEADLEIDPFITRSIKITDGVTYSKLMEEANVGAATSTAIFVAAEDVYDLSSIRVGRTLDLKYDKATGSLHQLVYQIDSEEELFVTATTSTSTSTDSTSTPNLVWQAERVPIDYDVKVVTREGTIETSMYQAALDAGIDERAIIELANVFQWSVDFALDVRTGDTFKFTYEERYRNGEYVMPASVLAGKYVNAGTEYYAFYFEESEDNQGYFDEEGNSVQKLFLKAPVAYKYISSGFTYGKRYVQAFNVSTGHRAIDYAAPAGTPIRAVGDGTVTRAGWSSAGYGNLTSIRHNGTYSTNYAHQSRIIVRVGQKVKQGETIGYVGSTGFSTGPHLHYEMVKNGVKVNPLLEVLPPIEAIQEENLERYFESIKELKQGLDL